MANTIDTKIEQNGPRNFVVAVQITGDGSGDATLVPLITAPADSQLLSVWRATGSFVGFGAALFWEHSTTASSKQALVLNDAWGCYEFARSGGLINTVSAASRTGNIRLSTYGLGNGDHGTMLLEFHKH